MLLLTLTFLSRWNDDKNDGWHKIARFRIKHKRQRRLQYVATTGCVIFFCAMIFLKRCVAVWFLKWRTYHTSSAVCWDTSLCSCVLLPLSNPDECCNNPQASMIAALNAAGHLWMPTDKAGPSITHILVSFRARCPRSPYLSLHRGRKQRRSFMPKIHINGN